MTVQTAPAARSKLVDRLGHRFDDPALLELALTHRSWCAEHSGSASNERLEFLGDAVLSLVVAQRLYERFEDWPEGDLAKTRASLISAATLADVGRSAGLGELLRLGRGEDASGGRSKPSILADALEAVIGAVYLDGGIDAADDAVGRLFGRRLEAAATFPGRADFKTRLQELAARLGLEPPSYSVTASGPAHRRLFCAEVRAGDEVGIGAGATKKDAEQHAAEMALSALSVRPGSDALPASDALRASESLPASEVLPASEALPVMSHPISCSRDEVQP